jgi:glycosyltransferase involved in cell wall biosynthesis
VPRLALVGPSWPFRGGIARTTTALAAALHERGSLAAFLVARRQYPAWLYPGGRDVDPGACPRFTYARPAFAVLEPWTWRELRRVLRECRPDAIVAPYWTWAWAPLFRATLGAGGAPPVAIVHNPVDHDAGLLPRVAARGTLQRFRGFLCHADAVAAQLRKGFEDRPVVVQPLPAVRTRRVDRDTARASLGVPPDAVAFLCFGLIRPYKGVDVLLDAFAALPAAARAMLLLAGEPWRNERARIESRLAGTAMRGRVVARLEWVPEDEIGTWFAAADVAVLPYRSATGSAVAAEAIAWGLPIVASAVGGLAETVVNGRNGLLVPPGDGVALRAALERVLDGRLRGDLAAGAGAAAGRLSWESYAACLERLVEDVLATSAGPAPRPGERAAPTTRRGR